MADSTLPQLHLGQRRLLQRLLHPRGRSLLLDEECLAGQGPALGGRHYRQNCVDQNFDSYSVEYTFADGTKLLLDGRCIGGCTDIYNSYLHGTKGSAIASRNGDCGAPSSIYKGQKPDHADLLWTSKVSGAEHDPYQNEWNDLIDAIRNDKPYNEAKRGVEASVVCNMGRIAAHTGREWTFEDTLNLDHEYAPGADKFTMDSPAPLKSNADGRYPVPQPGVVVAREF